MVKNNMITNHMTRNDIELLNKLDNMCGSEISESIYKECLIPENIEKIKNKVWELLTDTNSKFACSDYYVGLADDYEAKDEKDMWSACVYNCDLLYMTAIAHVFGLEIPKNSCDINIFGM